MKAESKLTSRHINENELAFLFNPENLKTFNFNNKNVFRKKSISKYIEQDHSKHFKLSFKIFESES